MYFKNLPEKWGILFFHMRERFSPSWRKSRGIRKIYYYQRMKVEVLGRPRNKGENTTGRRKEREGGGKKRNLVYLYRHDRRFRRKKA